MQLRQDYMRIKREISQERLNSATSNRRQAALAEIKDNFFTQEPRNQQLQNKQQKHELKQDSNKFGSKPSQFKDFLSPIDNYRSQAKLKPSSSQSRILQQLSASKQTSCLSSTLSPRERIKMLNYKDQSPIITERTNMFSNYSGTKSSAFNAYQTSREAIKKTEQNQTEQKYNQRYMHSNQSGQKLSKLLVDKENFSNQYQENLSQLQYVTKQSISETKNGIMHGREINQMRNLFGNQNKFQIKSTQLNNQLNLSPSQNSISQLMKNPFQQKLESRALDLPLQIYGENKTNFEITPRNLNQYDQQSISKGDNQQMSTRYNTLTMGSVNKVQIQSGDKDYNKLQGSSSQNKLASMKTSYLSYGTQGQTRPKAQLLKCTSAFNLKKQSFQQQKSHFSISRVYQGDGIKQAQFESLPARVQLNQKRNDIDSTYGFKKPSEWTEYSNIDKDKETMSNYLELQPMNSSCFDSELQSKQIIQQEQEILNFYPLQIETRNDLNNYSRLGKNNNANFHQNLEHKGSYNNYDQDQKLLYSFNQNIELLESARKQREGWEAGFQTFNSSNFFTQNSLRKNIHQALLNVDSGNIADVHNKSQNKKQEVEIDTDQQLCFPEISNDMETPIERNLPMPYQQRKDLVCKFNITSEKQMSKMDEELLLKQVIKLQRAFRQYLIRKSFKSCDRLKEYEHIRDNILSVLQKYTLIENTKPLSPKEIDFNLQNKLFSNPKLQENPNLKPESYQPNKYKRKSVSTSPPQTDKNSQESVSSLDSVRNPFSDVYKILGQVHSHISNIDQSLAKAQTKCNNVSKISYKEQQFKCQDHQLKKASVLSKYMSNQSQQQSNQVSMASNSKHDESEQSMTSLNSFHDCVKVDSPIMDCNEAFTQFEEDQNHLDNHYYEPFQNYAVLKQQVCLEESPAIQCKSLPLQNQVTSLQNTQKKVYYIEVGESPRQDQYQLSNQKSDKDQKAFDEYDWLRKSKIGSLVSTDTHKSSVLQSQTTPTFKDSMKQRVNEIRSAFELHRQQKKQIIAKTQSRKDFLFQ